MVRACVGALLNYKQHFDPNSQSTNQRRSWYLGLANRIKECETPKKICRLDESVWTLWWWPLVRLYIWTTALEAAASRSSTSQCTREGPINCSPSDRHAAGRSSHHADAWVQIVVRFTLQIIRKKYFARRCTCSKRKGIVWFQVPLSTLNGFPFIWGVHFSKRTSSHSSYWPGWSCWWIHTFLPMTSVIKEADLCAPLCLTPPRKASRTK